MNEFDYQSNSYKAKEEQREAAKKPEKKVEKVVSGKVKKKGEMQKLANTFISEEASNVKSYIWLDVLVPTIKKAIFDVITNSIDMILYGGNGRANQKPGVSRINYNVISSKPEERRYEHNRNRSVYNYGDVVVPTRGEAEEVLARMDEMIETYGMVSVMDLYDLVGVTGNYTDNKYGWTNLRNAEAVRVSDGYLLKLPRATPLT